MDVLETLGQLGEVDPADQAVLDRALGSLAEAAGLEDRPPSPRVKEHRGRLRLFVAAAAAIAAATAITVVLVDVGSGPAAKGARSGHAYANSKTPSVHAILTALSRYSGDILRVTKTMKGDHGTLGRTVIWLAPAEPAPGAIVRTRILNYSLSGARQSDMALTYTAGARAPRVARADCGIVFHRPRFDDPPPNGVPATRSPGTLTYVNYRQHLWGKASGVVFSATAPGAATLRACVQAGQWHISGRGSLAGTSVIELVFEPGVELWVSAATFLPVRLVSFGPSVDTITFSFSFLAPTAADRAMLTPPIPVGFAEQPPFGH